MAWYEFIGHRDHELLIDLITLYDGSMKELYEYLEEEGFFIRCGVTPSLKSFRKFVRAVRDDLPTQ